MPHAHTHTHTLHRTLLTHTDHCRYRYVLVERRVGSPRSTAAADCGRRRRTACGGNQYDYIPVCVVCVNECMCACSSVRANFARLPHRSARVLSCVCACSNANDVMFDQIEWFVAR